MAKFELEPGEVELSTHPLGLVIDRKEAIARLHLTDRRLVVVPVPEAPGWTASFGAIGAALLGQFFSKQNPNRISHQIVRQRFASVEQDGKLIVFHDDGEGYGHTSFAIRSKDSFATWHDRMHRWAAGAENAAPLPSAKLVDR